MSQRRRAVVALLAVLALLPVLAAGRPACCMTTSVAPPAAHACCRPVAGAQVTAPKPCCKAPKAPKSETRAKDVSPIAVLAPGLAAGTPAVVAVALPGVAAVRLARRAHHAEAPDDSPPDRLSLIQTLLI